MRKGAMARRPGTDPLAESLHRGSDLPERRPWVEPVPTNHLFYAPVSPRYREGGGRGDGPLRKDVHGYLELRYVPAIGTLSKGSGPVRRDRDPVRNE